MTSGRVAILLGVHDGVLFLDEQLQSLVSQTHSNWALIVSCDGSSDAARAIVEDFVCAHPDRDIRLTEGPRAGYARNFLHLLATGPDDADYFAFCDQDDVWLQEKIAHQVRQLEGLDGPAMVFGRTIICDQTLRHLGTSPPFNRPPAFANALVQNMAGGNTMMFNRKAMQVLRRAAAHASEIVSHDWWVYQVLSAVGATVIYDPEPTVLYRQHDSNLIGQNSTITARAKRIFLLFNGRFRNWTNRTIDSLAPLRETFTEDSRRVFDAFVAARGRHLPGRLTGLWRSGVHRQTRASQVALVIGFALGLI